MPRGTPIALKCPRCRRGKHGHPRPKLGVVRTGVFEPRRTYGYGWRGMAQCLDCRHVWASTLCGKREHGEPDVLYFSAGWCAPCREFGPVVERVCERLALRVRKIDIDESPPEARYAVRSVPVLVYGKRRLTGAVTEEALRTWLQGGER